MSQTQLSLVKALLALGIDELKEEQQLLLLSQRGSLKQ